MRAAARYCLAFIVSPKVTKGVGEILFALAGRRGRKEIDLRRVRRILIIRLDNIGDVILTTPLFGALRRRFPEAHIAVLVRPHCAELIERCPHIDEVIGFDWQTSWWLEELHRHWQAVKFAARRLWILRFDLVLIPRWGDDYRFEALIGYLSGAPWRVGFRNGLTSLEIAPKNGRDSLLTHALKRGEARHEVERSSEVLRVLGAEDADARPEVWTSPEDASFASRLLRQRGAEPDTVLVAFGVGASHPRRLWPVERYVEVASWLVKTYNARILVIGDDNDQARGRVLQQHLGERVIDVTHQTTLGQTWSLLKNCTLLVGSDSGPVHLAATAGTPVIVISCHPRNGLASHEHSPIRFRPWSVPHQVLQPQNGLDSCGAACSAEQPHCVTGVTVLGVEVAIQAQLAALGI